jgi:hypothetical protein
MKGWMVLSAGLLLASVLSLSSFAQNAGNDSNSVTIGDITKIDLKGKSITIGNAVSYNIAPAVGGRGAAGRGGGGRGGGGRGGRGGGGRGGGATAGSGAFIPQAPRTFKVAVSKAQFKQDDQEIAFGDLKVGDHIQVLGQTKGSKVEASEVVRMPKNNPEE